MPFDKPILKDTFPDIVWKDNFAVVLKWIDRDTIEALEDGSVYRLNVSHPYIKPFYIKYKDDIKVLAKESILKILQEKYYGKKIVEFAFQNIKVKIEEDVNIKLRELTPKDENTPLTFNCVILAVGRRQAYPKIGVFKCELCGDEERVDADNRRKLKIPLCSNRSCKKAAMVLDPDRTISEFVQDIVIQEPIDEIVNNQPVKMDAKLIDDDVGHSYMGQKKKITGVFRVDYDTRGKQKDVYMDIITIKDLDDVDIILPTDAEVEGWKKEIEKGTFKEKIIDSFAPHVFGYPDIKLAMLLAAISKRGRIKDVRRGWINVLLVGDPGMAKSMMLEYVQRITQKSTYTTGKGSTAAGLTAGMVKQDNGTSILQAGNYPLSHKGTAIVDEFDKMNKDDMGIMHEVMEQGKVSRSVSGQNVTLPAEAVTLAAANPRFGNYDESLTLIENIDLPTPILSRFDLIFLIRDKVDSIMDAKKADKVLSDFGSGDTNSDVYLCDKDMMKFINYATQINVELSPEAQHHLKKIYEKLREVSKKKGNLPVTPRTLEALGRLAMAHAKLTLKNVADVDDVKAVYQLYKETYKSFGHELEDVGTQLTLIKSEKLNKEQEFRKAWSKCEDEEQYVEEKDVMYILEKEFLWEKDKAQKHWNGLYGAGKIKKCSNMRYRWNE